MALPSQPTKRCRLVESRVAHSVLFSLAHLVSSRSLGSGRTCRSKLDSCSWNRRAKHQSTGDQMRLVTWTWRYSEQVAMLKGYIGPHSLRLTWKLPEGLWKWNQVFQRGPGSFHVRLEGNKIISRAPSASSSASSGRQVISAWSQMARCHAVWLTMVLAPFARSKPWGLSHKPCSVAWTYRSQVCSGVFVEIRNAAQSANQKLQSPAIPCLHSTRHRKLMQKASLRRALSFMACQISPIQSISPGFPLQAGAAHRSGFVLLASPSFSRFSSPNFNSGTRKQYRTPDEQSQPG